MTELLIRFIMSIIHIVWLHHIPFLPKLLKGSRKEVPSTTTWLIVVLQGGISLPTMKRTYCIALERPCQRVPKPLRVEWVCLIVLFDRFGMSCYTLTILRGYIQWVQPILHSYTIVWKSPIFHDRYSSLMHVASLGMLFKTHETAMFGLTKTTMRSTPMDSSYVSALICGQVLWMFIWLGLSFFHPT